MGSAATVAAYRNHAPGATVIHLATHAVVDPGRPRASALVLAASPDGSPLFFADEFAAIPLSADLVCLSACRTAGGFQMPGEGAFGLTRAFLVAGARTVVSSW